MADNLPTEPGYYWHRQIDEGSQEVFEWEVVQILGEQNGPGIVINGTTFQASEIACVWGPHIPDPDETRETDEAIKRSIQTATDHVRDSLARQLLVGILANSQLLGTEDGVTLRTNLAYRYADAMMAEREKRN